MNNLELIGIPILQRREKDKTKYPLVNPPKWAKDYFKNNLNISGMAIGGGMNGILGPRLVILNPYTDYNKDSVLKNERLRHYFDESGFKLPNVTKEQVNKYKGTPYEGDTLNIGRTETARYLTGDKHLLTTDQIDYINNSDIPSFKQGGIHIKKKNKGTFTKYCNGKVTQACIDKAKRSGNKKLIKRAVFAENSRKWAKKHLIGGILSWLKDQFIKFGNALIAGDSGVGTAMAIASGYEHNPKTGKWEQTEERLNDPSVKALRDNLSVISSFAMGPNPIIKQGTKHVLSRGLSVVKEVADDVTKVGKHVYKKIGEELLKGAAGYTAGDALSQAITDKTWGENVALLMPESIPYGIREGLGNLTSPFGVLGSNSKILLNTVKQLPKNTFHFLGQFNLSPQIRFVKDMLRTDLSRNPIKRARFLNLLRKRKYTPKVHTGNYNYTGFANSQDDPIDLLRSRYLSGGKSHSERLGFTLDSPEEAFNSVTVSDYTPMSKVYELIRRNTQLDKIKSAIVTPYTWVNVNLSPGFNLGNYIGYNPRSLKRLRFPRNITLAHEYDHALNSFGLTDPPIRIGHLPKGILKYFTPTEISARGTLIKNYFGFNRDDLKLTGDMLRYAADNYVKDTGMDNNMTLFFSTIRDWDAMADWINKMSLKLGGQLTKNN